MPGMATVVSPIVTPGRDAARIAVGGSGSGTVTGAPPGWPRQQPTAGDDQPPSVLVEADLRLLQPRIGQLGSAPAECDQLPVPGQQLGVRLAGQLGPVQLGTQERLAVLRIRDVGGGPAVRGELAAPALRDGLGQPGSSWSVKYCQGVSAPHSSPMNSIGVNGAVSTSPAPTLSRPGGTRLAIRSPTARFPIWSWSCR